MWGFNWKQLLFGKQLADMMFPEEVEEPEIPRPDAPVGLPEEGGFKKPTRGKIGSSRGRTVITGALTPQTFKRQTLG